MKKILICLSVFGGGCAAEGIPLEQHIAEVKACKEAGGEIREMKYSEESGGAVYKVNCYFADSIQSRTAKPCLEKGGVPILSSWDGTLKDCKFKEGRP